MQSPPINFFGPARLRPDAKLALLPEIKAARERFGISLETWRRQARVRPTQRSGQRRWLQPAERKLAATSTHLSEQGCDIRTVQRLMGRNYVARLSESRPKLRGAPRCDEILCVLAPIVPARTSAAVEHRFDNPNRAWLPRALSRSS